ncbi:DNA-deoxyinosine glycosylase [Methylomonas paludis]|uniref:DNA-deoxyinosine glycosylase n=1 Tax=Methylomonas paludis TaxID=1173101 RepID=A0A975MLF2_9GAMM|nr:DNA-deoxyinosine glycosylase [Methylomonas paludis]QWF69982.1 DNA-deoxyinosine glycosylase [Methylomonas paludis]
MAEIFSFAPIVADGTRVLILGSMPGIASLQAQQYYAHPRNQFWPILTELMATDVQLSYAQRCDLLLVHGIAVWDVLKSCQRRSSLDSDIDKSSMVCNDFVWLFSHYPGINQVFFNGSTAEQAFRRRVLPQLTADSLKLTRLPSTSPAHASLNFQQKLACWRQIIPTTQAETL